jgi:abnormal spindle-like microcephaly-associated protein
MTHFSFTSTLQRRFRGLLGRILFFQKWEELQAACVIQSYWKHCLAKNELATRMKARDAAYTIQRSFRGYICRLDYACMVQSIVDLQGVARGFLARKELQRRNVAAAVIQRAWWGIVGYWERDEAALLIQGHWRSVCARQKFEMRVLQSDSACAIQRMWRGYFDRLIFEITVQSVIAIQKIARGHQGRKVSSVKKSRNAAIIIQKAWRGFAAQIQCQLDLLDIITIQSIARRKSTMNQIKLRHRAVGTLQRSFRSATARQILLQKVEARETAYRENAAATQCQVNLI